MHIHNFDGFGSTEVSSDGRFGARTDSVRKTIRLDAIDTSDQGDLQIHSTVQQGVVHGPCQHFTAGSDLLVAETENDQFMRGISIFDLKRMEPTEQVDLPELAEVRSVRDRRPFVHDQNWLYEFQRSRVFAIEMFDSVWLFTLSPTGKIIDRQQCAH